MRVITDTDYPSNVAVFHAATVSEAVEKTEHALEEGHIQGAVWLKPNFQTASPLTIPDFSGITNLISITAETEALSKDILCTPTEISEEFKGIIKPDLLSFAKQALSPKLCLYFAMQTFSGSPHIESIFDFDDIKRTTDGTPFGSMPVRVIETLQGQGTEIYDPDEIDSETYNEIMFQYPVSKDSLPEPWTVNTGDALFMTLKVWGREKALVHNAPSIDVSCNTQARVTKVTDLNFPR